MSRGGKRAGAGRKSGAPNKATSEFRETVRQVLESNSENVGKWLSQVASEDPAKALDLLAKLAEFAAPKLGRIEMDVEGDVTVSYVARMPEPTTSVGEWLERSR